MSTANEAGRTIPIVLAVDSDPVGKGFVASLARPGGNIKGLSDLHRDLAPKRLELLKEVVLSLSRVAVLLNPDSPTSLQLKNLKAVAPKLGMTLLSFQVGDANYLDCSFVAMEKEHSGALVVIGNPYFSSHIRPIAELSLRTRLLAICSIAKFPEAGGLMSYGTDFDDLYRCAAYYVDKILRGAKPADLPVE